MMINNNENNKVAINKEQFDFSVFARMYPNDNGPKRLIDNPVDRERYEKMYYADELVTTIAEFVDKLDKMDETA